MKSLKVQYRIGYNDCCLVQAKHNKSIAGGDISAVLTPGVKDEK